MKPLQPLVLSGKEVLPLVEGGKGISISNGVSTGTWALAGGVGTFSGVNADSYDEDGRLISMVYHGKTRRARHEELIKYSIAGGITQAQIAHDLSRGEGRIHMNILWEMGAVEKILIGILEKTRGLIHGVTCGAGMPYRVAQIASHFDLYYYPIVSSARAFRILWKRSYHAFSEKLGGVVYEDPWLAGGHNGLSNNENPQEPEDPYHRVRLIRQLLNEYSLPHVPIIMAGGVWHLKEWKDWIDNDEIGPIAFQFGTRPLLTKESPISQAWKKLLLTLKPGDIILNKFSPTGFYSSAISNSFLKELMGRSQRQIPYALEPSGLKLTPFPIGVRGRLVYVTQADAQQAAQWTEQGYITALKTPDKTLIFVTPEKASEIHEDQVNCMGCLSACRFSNWSQTEKTTGERVDPRSFCIQKTLQAVSHRSDIDHELVFAGHNAYRFAQDPFYQNGFIPTIAELIQRILTGA